MDLRPNGWMKHMTPAIHATTTLRPKVLLPLLLAALLALTAWQPPPVSAASPAAGKTKVQAGGCSRKVRVPRHGKKRTRRCKSRSRSLQITFTPTGSPEKKTEPTPVAETAREAPPSKHQPSPVPAPLPVEESAPPAEEPVEASEPPQPVEEAPGEAAGSEEPAPAPFRFFSPLSFWNTPIPVDIPVDPESEPLVDRLAAVAAQETLETGGPAI